MLFLQETARFLSLTFHIFQPVQVNMWIINYEFFSRSIYRIKHWLVMGGVHQNKIVVEGIHTLKKNGWKLLM